MNYRNWSWMCVCVCERRWFALNKCGWGSCIIDRRTYVMKQSGWKLSSAWDNFSSHKDYWETDATDKPFLNRKQKWKWLICLVEIKGKQNQKRNETNRLPVNTSRAFGWLVSIVRSLTLLWYEMRQPGRSTCGLCGVWEFEGVSFSTCTRSTTQW